MRAAGYAVDTAGDGTPASRSPAKKPYALIILDVGLPDMSGFEVLKRLRQRGIKTPILILTARDTVQDRVTGLDLGADDYLLKPFEPSELEARIRALLRRSQGDPSPVVTIGTLVIDHSLGTATVNGRSLDLRRREWAVLERLVARPGKLVSKERLTSEVFGFDEPVAPERDRSLCRTAAQEARARRAAHPHAARPGLHAGSLLKAARSLQPAAPQPLAVAHRPTVPRPGRADDRARPGARAGGAWAIHTHRRSGE